MAQETSGTTEGREVLADEKAQENRRITVDRVFRTIVDQSLSNSQQGTEFEEAVKFFLTHDPAWKSRLQKCWMWNEAPTAITHGKHDIGIDLVAQDVDGSYWAIQVKCYQKDTIALEDVSTFLATAQADKNYSHYLLADTTDGMSDNLRQAVKGLEDRFVRIDLDNMKQANLDWKGFLEHPDTSEQRHTYDPRPHQQDAIKGIYQELSHADRCTLVMACGTGKTLTALRYAEKRPGSGGLILYLAPSISLISQSLRYWANQVRGKINPYVVCSDPKASQIKSDQENDIITGVVSDLAFPATTNPRTLGQHFKRRKDAINVIFSTYQSIDVIHQAQASGMIPTFDLTICDEAHRTTGLIKSESAFQRIHDSDFIHSTKRLYMTATPRVYSASAKALASSHTAEVASMDDPKIFGRVAYRLGFGEAVDLGLLTDYKIVVMNVSEKTMSAELQKQFGEEDKDIPLNDAAKYIGCWKALFNRTSALGLHELTGIHTSEVKNREQHRILHRAIAFEPTIKASKALADKFKNVINAYIDSLFDKKEHKNDLAQEQNAKEVVRVGIEHVDGSTPSPKRREKLNWLDGANGNEIGPRECRILTNARCLSEGIDVPDLDAVIYFSARRSKIDIIQSVGRVMRKAPGKKYGYIILPVFIPHDVQAGEVLSSGAYKIVWQVVSALRSHDERLDAKINAAGLGDRNALKGAIEVESVDEQALRAQLAAVEKDSSNRTSPSQKNKDVGTGYAESEYANEPVHTKNNSYQPSLSSVDQQLAKQINAEIVKRCGTKMYWDEWTDDIATIAKERTRQISELVRPGKPAHEFFERFLLGLRRSLNDRYTAKDAIEVLAQHEMTKPIFETLFREREVLENNAIVKGLDRALDSLYQQGLPHSIDDHELRNLYGEVRLAARQITDDAAKQKLVKEIYNEFFSKVFSNTSKQLGLVYTPVELVDAQLHMVQRALEREFGRKLGDPNVHVLDGFAGTGTYLCRLIEDPTLISADALPHKYNKELHSNEIVPLAATIMDVNIEESYHKRIGGDYQAFPGALLTDTFQMYEEGDQDDNDVFEENSKRVREQRKLKITVIVGNPPYRVGRNASGGAQNVKYEHLDQRIKDTYASEFHTNNQNSLYDNYIRAFRWASDRIHDSGIICFVSNGGWLTGRAEKGMRYCFTREFNDIYVYNLRGNRRTQGEQARKEGGQIFGSGSRATIAITMLVKNPQSTHHGVIHYKDIGDYLTRDEKLNILKSAVKKDPDWTLIKPDRNGDWLNQQKDTVFRTFLPLGNARNKKPGIFSIWSNGLKTQRDAWCYNFSRTDLDKNMRRSFDTYSHELQKFKALTPQKRIKTQPEIDETKIHWTRALQNDLHHLRTKDLEKGAIVSGSYRPFTTEWLWYDRQMNEMMYQQEELFPTGDDKNIVISSGERGTFITNMLPDLELNHHAQCFPLYYYDKETPGTLTIDEDTPSHGYIRHDAISNEALAVFRTFYSDKSITKEDIFYYTYGILNSPEYRRRFANDLTKGYPRLPLSTHFKEFKEAGYQLAQLHLNYEKAERYPVEEVGDSTNPGLTIKMRYPRKTVDPVTKKKVTDRTALQVSEHLTIVGIPMRAYDYVINGKSALAWIIERYQIKEDKKSRITNDPNKWSNDPRYIVDLVEKVITVSMKTLDIIEKLPPLDEKPLPPNQWPATWQEQ